MEYPKYDTDYAAQFGTDPATGYREFVHQDTTVLGIPDIAPVKHEEQASWLAAKANTVAIKYDAPPQEFGGLKSAYRVLKNVQIGSQDIQRRVAANLLKVSISMLESHATEERLENRRTKTHERCIEALRTNVERFGLPFTDDGGRPSSKGLGLINEYVTLGLMTRLRHPGLIAVSSLSHHDRRRMAHWKEYNHDVTLIESSGNSTTAHRIQVKSPCFGLCVDHPSHQQASRDRHFQKMRSQYSNDVTLISGCCDLGTKVKNGKLASHLTELLIAEYDGNLTASQIRRLDNISNSLLLTVTGDPGRRGSYDSPTLGNAERINKPRPVNGIASESPVRDLQQLNTSDAAKRMGMMFKNSR